MDWAIFFIIIFGLLALDLGVLNKRDRIMSARESVLYSVFYFSIGLLFGVFVWLHKGATSGAEYFTGFLIEKILSLDNIFLISVIFSFLNIPIKYQHRVLFWGIMGVIILRGILIYLGASLVENFAWVMYIFAVILIYTGFKMLFMGDKPVDIENSFLLNFIKKNLPYTDKLDGNKFFTSMEIGGKKKSFITPLMLALILIEFTDLIFAVDSVPAIFSITTNLFIIYTSNIFAILGLRALYFTILAVIEKFKYLKISLSIILVFIGSKVFIKDLLGLEKFPPVLSLSITIGIILAGVLYSMYAMNKIKSDN
jgi:tellurite resistance protein TerC